MRRRIHLPEHRAAPASTGMEIVAALPIIVVGGWMAPALPTSLDTGSGVVAFATLIEMPAANPYPLTCELYLPGRRDPLAVLLGGSCVLPEWTHFHGTMAHIDDVDAVMVWIHSPPAPRFELFSEYQLDYACKTSELYYNSSGAVVAKRYRPVGCTALAMPSAQVASAFHRLLPWYSLSRKYAADADDYREFAAAGRAEDPAVKLERLRKAEARKRQIRPGIL